MNPPASTETRCKTSLKRHGEQDASEDGESNGFTEPPCLSRFFPRHAYVSTFDMLHDNERNKAYSEAIRLLAITKSRPDDDHDHDATPRRWLDIGTGSGLLASLVSSQSSSSSARLTDEVYACEEVVEVAEVAAKTFKRNGQSVRLFIERSTELNVGGGGGMNTVPSRASHVVAELLGTGLLDEGVIPTMRDAKKRLLEAEFVSVPSSAQVWIQCYESEELGSTSRLSEDNEHFRVPLSENWANCPGAAAPASMHVRPPRWGGIGFRPISAPIHVFEFDFTDLPDSSGQTSEIYFAANAGGTIHAVVCWWRCFMDKGRTIALSTAPSEEPAVPTRDHWRQCVFVLPRPLLVASGQVVRTVAHHDDNMMWFDALICDPGKPTVSATSGARSPGTCKRRKGDEGSNVVSPIVRENGLPSRVNTKDASRVTSSGPPVCVCGLHRTCTPSRIWMLNNTERTATFRAAVRELMTPCSGNTLVSQADGGRIEGENNRSQNFCICVVSDGFLLPLIAAQEGASDVLEIQPSATASIVCRDVYRANGVADKIRAFPGGVSSVYDLLSPPAGSPDVIMGVGSSKLDAVIGEPFFDHLSHCWPMEPLILFWCVRTALEAGGRFSPRTRVVPARAILLCCPVECDLLFRTRRRVGMVEGIDMSSVNDLLGYRKPSREGDAIGLGAGEKDDTQRHSKSRQQLHPEADAKSSGDDGIMSVRLQEYPHALLGPPTVVLDMDLTLPLCDLKGGRTEVRCTQSPTGPYRQESVRSAESGKSGCDTKRRQLGGASPCHGVALWLELWLDENGNQRLSTGPDAGFSAQGLVLFDEEWSVPRDGRSFQFEAVLEDGALRAQVS